MTGSVLSTESFARLRAAQKLLDHVIDGRVRLSAVDKAIVALIAKAGEATVPSDQDHPAH